MYEAQLGGVDLRGALLDVRTKLAAAHFDSTVLVAGAIWNGVSLNQVAWEQVPSLGDEVQAYQAMSEGQRKDVQERQEDFEAAARAYRQLAIALRDQGITEAADRFTYRGLHMQRKALWWQLRGGCARSVGLVPYASTAETLALQRV